MFCLFCWFFENNCPGGEVSERFFCPRGRGFALSLCPGVEIRPFKKFPWDSLGGWSDLELTDTLRWLFTGEFEFKVFIILHLNDHNFAGIDPISIK